MSSWGCPHDIKGKCVRMRGVTCDPGMSGCVLYGRFRWADESKNRPRRPVMAADGAAAQDGGSEAAPDEKPTGNN